MAEDGGLGDDTTKLVGGNHTMTVSCDADEIDLGTGHDTLIVNRCGVTHSMRGHGAGDVLNSAIGCR